MAAPSHADEKLDPAASQADVVILGERHNTAAHQAFQAQAIRALQPVAVVFEQLTPGEASRISGLLASGSLPDALAGDGFHWPGLIDYLPVFEAAAGARVLGTAVPPEDMRRAFSDGAAAVFGAGAADYGLGTPLPDGEQNTREEMQFVNHCEAMPREMMPGMVDAQRLRDAVFARTVRAAVKAHGTPVVLVTGWGHARKDWGVPVYLSRAAPELDVFALGLRESAEGADLFDQLITTAPEAGRGDPCAAFQ
ncbi:ChaN family lipoprotein [Pseudaestuariivita sp.]|uniref:ChaN family lipoprotein n=1 Tax=Pseudaestuariivita sp. TaxID=2211669 RepID=UPI0040590823